MSVIFGGGPSQSIPPLVKGIVAGYPTELRNGGGSVVVSAAGAIVVTPGSTAATPSTGGVTLSDTGTALALRVHRGIVSFVNETGAAYASIQTHSVTAAGTLTVTGTGTHTFGGPIKMDASGSMILAREASGNRGMLVFQRTGSATNHFTAYLADTTNDTYFAVNNGATESFRLLNASGYLKAASRFGVAVDPSYPLHVAGQTYITQNTGIGAVPNSSYALLASAGSSAVSASFFQQTAASATVPVVINKLGSSPGTGGHAEVWRDSADNNVALLSTVVASGYTALNLYSANGAVSPAPLFQGYRSRGSLSLPSAVQSGDLLTYFAGYGYGATGWATAARGTMIVTASENWTDTAQGTHISFRITNAGTTTTAEAMRLSAAGYTQVNRLSAGLAFGTDPSYPLHVSGSSQLAGYTGINTAPDSGTAILVTRSAGATIPAVQFRQDAASATVPVMIIKLGATPGVGGDALQIRNSAETTLWYIGAGGKMGYSSVNTQSTVGAAGAASALPATPSGYMKVTIAGTDYALPYYAAA